MNVTNVAIMMVAVVASELERLERAALHLLVGGTTKVPYLGLGQAPGCQQALVTVEAPQIPEWTRDIPSQFATVSNGIMLHLAANKL